MVSKLKKNQGYQRLKNRRTGVIIDCEEITISVFPPPREHGRAHCHVTSKKSCKVKGVKFEIFPELKIFLDGSGIVVITEGFSMRDIQTIIDIVFNEPNNGVISNDMYLQKLWEALHGKSQKS